ncbi:MAG: hypothetical protein JL56_13025 [Desulfotomaculum sp. BICA1-6]|nr:MAG: hypothetical protein JL56_13025 [Desulfotomaculum sp. BICA1-6]
MPWLWRPLWGTIWIDGDRAVKGNDGGSGGGKEGKENAAREGEQQVKNRGSMPKWGAYVGRSAFYNPYQTSKKPPAKEQESEFPRSVDDAVDEVMEEKDHSVEDFIDEVIEEKDHSVEDFIYEVIEEKGHSFEDVVDEVIKEKAQSVDDAVDIVVEEKEKGQQVHEKGDNNQIIDSISRQFEEVSPGVFQFKRPTAPAGWKAQPPGVGTRQPVRVDVAWYRSALPSAIADYHQVGQTRDGLPVYSFK